MGRTADYVLRDHKECIDLFITASMEARIKAVCRRRGCDRATAAKYIKDNLALSATTLYCSTT